MESEVGLMRGTVYQLRRDGCMGYVCYGRTKATEALKGRPGVGFLVNEGEKECQGSVETELYRSPVAFSTFSIRDR